VSKSPLHSHFLSIEVCAVAWLSAASLAPFSRSVGLFAYTSHGCLLANSVLSGFVVVLGFFVKYSVVLKLYASAAFSFDFLGAFLSIFVVWSSSSSSSSSSSFQFLFTVLLRLEEGGGWRSVQIAMEDPRMEIEDVVRGLVEKPTLRRQAAVLRKYFTPDVQFYHLYINTNGGLRDLIAIYQFAELAVNYQRVVFDRILYDESENCLSVEMTVDTRPWFRLGAIVPLKLFTLLELEDREIEVIMGD
jgi:hypothetical protein